MGPALEYLALSERLTDTGRNQPKSRFYLDVNEIAD